MHPDNDQDIAKDFVTDQTFVVNSPRAFSLVVKVRIMLNMGNTAHCIQVYKDILLLLLIDRVDNNRPSTKYDIIKCYNSLRTFYAQVCVEKYEEVLHWVQEDIAAVTVFKHTNTFTLVASLDSDMKMIQGYQDILNRNREYEGLALALAQNVQFADVSALPTTPDSPYIQFASLIDVMIFCLATK